MHIIVFASLNIIVFIDERNTIRKFKSFGHCCTTGQADLGINHCLIRKN